MGGMEDMQNDQNDLVKINSNNKHAREQDEPNWEEPPRKLRAKAHVDYRFLDNPFPDEEQNEEYNMNEALIAYNIQTEMPLGGRDPLTLCKAQKSSDWSEWKKAILVELEQLQLMGTWNLVDCPNGSVPNKWVFLTKYDYTDTFSPVVWLETI